MTSLRDGIYAVAAADTALLALLTEGAGGLRGSTTSAPPPATGLWAILDFEVEAASLSPNTVDGAFRWWLYDDEQRGYGRIDQVAGRLLGLYLARTGHLYLDTGTGEDIWWQGAGLLGPPLQAEEYGQRLRWVTFPYRKTHPGLYVAA